MKTVLMISISGQRVQHLQHVPDGWQTILTIYDYLFYPAIYLSEIIGEYVSCN